MNVYEHAREATAARERLYRAAKDGGYLPRMMLHRYVCSKCGVVAEVFMATGEVLAAVRDYKLSPGLNAAESVPAARERNTLDGERHWPWAVYSVTDLAVSSRAGFDVICRHMRTTVNARDLHAKVVGIEPGRPGAPTRSWGGNPHVTL